MRTVIAASVDVEVTVAQAWAAITDWAGQGAWMPMTTVDVVTDTKGVGTRLRAATGVGPAAVVDVMEIDRWDPPHRCDVRHDGRIIRGRGVFLVEPLGDTGARVIWEEHLDGLAARATAPAGRRMLNIALRRFAATLPAAR